jgi:hypothetical protein
VCFILIRMRGKRMSTIGYNTPSLVSYKLCFDFVAPLYAFY